MKQKTLYPSAKINIGLYVFEKRADNFHEIESIFYPVGADNSNLTPDKLTVTILQTPQEAALFLSDETASTAQNQDRNSCPEKVRMIETGLEYPGRPEDNICVKAYNLLDADFDLPPAVISLEKHLPTGAGLGGGSSDGVCTLRALNELCDLHLTEAQLMSYAAKLGSDCPFFVRNEPMLVTGRGEILTPLTGAAISKALKNLRENYTVQIIFSPDCFVSTKKAYSIVPKRSKKDKPQAPYIPMTELVTEPVETWQGRIVNDFEAPVFNEFPQLQKVKDSLIETGAAYVSMTGSGSAIFGLFPIND
ncbi:MAG: 4-(cytidine 5'-diphospho)-2-C-methyl-D-erythritol kinase [Bacteroidales bacterium]|nr:4-(cytidine 5'-diphospho)-2-C-methyl-D-erythritol kinase [Bacteroidales bacterium]